MKKMKVSYLSIISIFLMILIFKAENCYGQNTKEEKIKKVGFNPTLSAYVGRDKEKNLKISKINVDVIVVGKLSVTTVDITFKNTYDRILEGLFEFPLSEGQTVSRFAMEINGNLREGVVVEKDKGRITFEDIERRGVDPGLLEKLKGNIFRSRVYPIRPNSEKRIVIGFEEILTENNEGIVYLLPFKMDDDVDSFKLNVKVVNDCKIKNSPENEIDNVSFNKNSDGYVFETEETDYTPDEQFEFYMESLNNRKQIFIDEKNGKKYFSVNLNFNQDSIPTIPRILPTTLCVLWDASNSRISRIKDRELSLLKEYLSNIRNCKLELVVFANDIISSKTFNIKNSNTQELENDINQIVYDGGTQLGRLDLNKYNSDEFLLFSDGISNFGKKEIKTNDKPVFIINSSQTADHASLNMLALKTNGTYINLMRLTDEQALNQLLNIPLTFISADYSQSEIEKTFPSYSTIIDRDFVFSGILNSEKAQLVLNFGYGKNITNKETIILDSKENLANTGIIEKIWAKKKLFELELEPEKNKQDIINLGKEFNIVTENTSLIVLETVNDYVKYNIEPPEELRREFHSLISDRNLNDERNNNEQKEQIIKSFQDYSEWYETDFNAKKVLMEYQENQTRMNNLKKLIRVDGLDTGSQFTGGSGEGRASSEGGSGVQLEDPLVPYQEDNSGFNSFIEFSSKLKNGNSNGQINLTEYNPDVPYLNKIRNSNTNESYKIYLSYKEEYGKNPGFYVDVANEFFRKGDTTKYLRVISNVTELKLEDHELLRILGYSLKNNGQPKLAKTVFEEVIKIRSEEPHSYRDLALTLEDLGEYQQAADILYETALKEWDSRFDKIEIPLLNEFNRLLTLFPNKIDKSKYDTLLIKSMPLDIRVVLNWSSDNCDIDMHVSDPIEECCYYGYKLTKIGGKLVTDFTRGYGPEEFLLKKSIPGKYKVEAKYFGNSIQKLYGPTRLMMELYTNYATPNEKKKVITLELSKIKEKISVGEFVIE